MIGQMRAFILLALVMLPAASALAQAEEPLYETVKIVREATFKAPNLYSNSGKFRVEVDLKRQSDGTLAGPANYSFRWQHDHANFPPSIWDGTAKFDVVGTQQGGAISLVTPVDYKITLHNVWQKGNSYEIKHQPSGWGVYNQWNVFKFALTNLRYSAKEHQEFQVSGPITADVTTEATATPAPSLRVAVSAKRPLIPGHLRYFNELTVALSGPSAPTDGATVLVSLEAGDLGRLSEDQGWAGTPTLKLTGVKPGQPRTFYYAWAAAPPTAVYRATVTATVEGAQQAKGSANFEVGVNFEVVRAAQLVGQSISTGKRTLIGVRVHDSLHPDKDPGALAGELGIRPVLGMKQTGFIPLANIEQFVDGLSLNAAGLLEYAMGVAHGGSAHSIGDAIDWNVSQGGLLTGHGGTSAEGYPTILFQDRGVFVFEFDVTALTYADGRMPEPESPKHVARFHTTQLDPNSAFLFETLMPCIQGVVGALKEDPFAQAQALWECLHGAISSELAQNAIGHNVIANTIGGLIAQAIDEGFLIGGHEPTAAAEQVSDQAVEMIQSALKKTPGTYVTLVEKSGTTRLNATSSTAGALERGPAKLDLRAIRPTGDADRARAAEAYAPNRRIQEGKRFVVVAAAEKETLKLDLGGERGRGEIVIVSSNGVARAAYPAGPWTSQVEIRPDGTMRVVSGTAMDVKQRATKPANGAPAKPTAAPDAQSR